MINWVEFGVKLDTVGCTGRNISGLVKLGGNIGFMIPQVET